MIIRRASPEDAQAISTLLQAETRRHLHCDCTPEGLQHLLDDMSVEAVRQRMATEYTHWLAQRDARIVGVCVLRGESHLFHLFVASDCHRQGIARHLFETLLEHCRARLPAGDALTVNASLRAVTVYEKLGFTAHGAPRLRNGLRFQPMRRELAR